MIRTRFEGADTPEPDVKQCSSNGNRNVWPCTLLLQTQKGQVWVQVGSLAACAGSPDASAACHECPGDGRGEI